MAVTRHFHDDGVTPLEQLHPDAQAQLEELTGAVIKIVEIVAAFRDASVSKSAAAESQLVAIRADIAGVAEQHKALKSDTASIRKTVAPVSVSLAAAVDRLGSLEQQLAAAQVQLADLTHARGKDVEPVESVRIVRNANGKATGMAVIRGGKTAIMPIVRDDAGQILGARAE